MMAIVNFTILAGATLFAVAAAAALSWICLRIAFVLVHLACLAAFWTGVDPSKAALYTPIPCCERMLKNFLVGTGVLAPS